MNLIEWINYCGDNLIYCLFTVLAIELLMIAINKKLSLIDIKPRYNTNLTACIITTIQISTRYFLNFFGNRLSNLSFEVTRGLYSFITAITVLALLSLISSILKLSILTIRLSYHILSVNLLQTNTKHHLLKMIHHSSTMTDTEIIQFYNSILQFIHTVYTKYKMLNKQVPTETRTQLETLKFNLNLILSEQLYDDSDLRHLIAEDCKYVLSTKL